MSNLRQTPDAEAVKSMKASPYNFPDTTWLAFENHDFGSADLGHLKFLAVGPQNTIKRDQIKNTLPDFPGQINWRYQLVGRVDLEIGEIILEVKP